MIPINQAGPEMTSQLETVRLEYVCTPAEMEEAQSLFLRKKLGRGSKRLTQIVLLAVLVGMLLALYFRMGQIFPAKALPLVYTVVVAACVGFVFWKRLNRKQRGVTQVELSRKGLTFLGADSRTDIPWSAFGEFLESPKVFALLDRQKGIIFALPKRAFPDEAAQEWFRTLAKDRPTAEALPIVRTTAISEIATTDQVTVTFQLSFRDYIGRTLASHQADAVILAVLLLMLGTWAYTEVNPPPHAVNSPIKVLFVFMIPIWAAMVPFMYLMVSLATWRQHKKYLIPQEVILSANSIRMTSSDGNSTLPWSTYPRYKETRRLFILWNPRGRVWFMLPKRAFALKDDQERCRMLLASNSRPSRWYFG